MENIEKFKKLNLSESILKAITSAKFKEPTEIQEKTIPLLLEGKDVIASSATGSGKTLAYGAGIIGKIEKGKGIQALVLTPTRELAEQVTRSLRVFSHHYGLNINEIYGGVSIEPQIRGLSRADIVVGTPGRILDHLDRRTLDLRKIKFLVLDEADRMLEMGFINDVEKIINSCPKERQTMLFSATISQDIERIAARYMKHPVRVEVESYINSSKLTQIYYDTPSNMKFSLLVALLKKEKSGLVMVFCNTRRNTDLVAKNLKRYGIRVLAIHGGLSQNKRNDIIQTFHSEEVLTLVCTDVAARGLDIKNVSHVYNYDVPKTSIEYIHRIGRTARAGKEGIAISLVSQRDYDNFRKVCEDDSLKIENKPLPELEYLPVNFSIRDGSSFRQRSFGDKGRRSYTGFRREGPRSFGGQRSEHKPREQRSEGEYRQRSQRSEGEHRSYRPSRFGNKEKRRSGRPFGGRERSRY